MAVTATPIFPQAVNIGFGTIVPADAQTYKTVFTAGANGSKVDSLVISSNDTSARDVTINITRSGTSYQLGQISLPITAGYLNTQASIDALRSALIPGLPYDANGNKCIYLKSGDTITINAPVTITAAKQITAIAQGADY